MRWLIAILAVMCVPALARAQDAPPIAAASDLQAALPEVAAAFQKATGQSVRLTFGSSGNFAQQIENGAPFQVFLSADESYVQTLQAAGRTEGAGALYAIGRIGLFTPRGSPVRADAGLKDLAAAVRDGRVQKFAIANPAHAPYGRAAREVLQTTGIWTAIEPRLVLGENVSQATQFVTSGSVQAGLIPQSLGLTPQVKAAGAFVLVPAAWHKPLRQRAVVLRGAGPTARAFYAFLQGREGRAILVRYGFTLPR
ncbi:molybdate ABC transporter substrate-binding protein [Phenylobacterium sp.]|uniref:molybdate ABC transporter substrate-binding protein n=1 Tax=Phenylobacterium sp. TaxID=1871053 RepID=UPI003983971B